MFINNILKKSKLFKKIRYNLNNQNQRDEFVISCIKNLPSGIKILDAGCGSQRYKKYCGHLNYFSNDTGKYTKDQSQNLFSEGINGFENYEYGEINYKSNVWNIKEESNSFDAILCTEVFEHIPYPDKALSEFSRLLKNNGTLILTLPSNCLRHMDPEFYFSGFSNHWINKFLKENKFEIKKLETVGDYFSWMAVEISRSATIGNLITKILLFPSFLYFYYKKKNEKSKNTLCMGYHVLASKNEQSKKIFQKIYYCY